MFTATVRRKRHMKLPTTIDGPKKVKVGFPAGEAGGSVIERAIYNEFGTQGGASGGGWGGPVPERPFMRNSMRDNRSKYKSGMTTAAKGILRGDTALRTVLSKLGIMAQGDIQSEITSLSSPPNSPVTIELKGSSKPLIDSGEMRQAVTYKVDE